ncbi:MAG: hypothetical protein Q4G66_09030 [bacterium]|nr:hypothetical protein [bacterium]
MGQERGRDNWRPENYSRIQEALARLAAGEEAVGAEPLCAVFDFDNTCIFRDIGQAVFRVQLLDLHYRISPNTLALLIPAEGEAMAGRPWGILRSSILAHYQKLWPLIQAGKQEEAKASPAYQPFVALFYWLVANARSAPNLGPRYVLSLLAKLQAGYSLQELQGLCLRILEQVGREPLVSKSLQAQLPEPLGIVSTSYPTGLRPFAEMPALMRLFQSHGLRCYVVSASSEWLVQTVAPVLGFPLDPADIFGVRTRMAAGDVVLAEDAADYPLTYREGKNEVIDRFIKAGPWFVAGDADTDYDMLTRPGVSIRLLINRNLSGLIAELYDRPDILLQGIDQGRGSFRPSSETLSA